MKVIYGIGKVKGPFKNAVLAIGVFDGVHRGHQYLINRMIRRAKAIGGTSIVVTFHPHPIRVVHPEYHLEYLISVEQRLAMIEKLGADVCVVLHFTKSFAQLSPERFVKDYVMKKFAAKEVFVGDDFRFGQNRSGNIEIFDALARRFGFRVHHIHAVENNRVRISSSRLREEIKLGQLSEARRLLGRRFALMGTVVKGEGRGRKLGFPTANLKVESDVIPPRGVYLVAVHLDGRMHKGLVNIGVRPSFKTRSAQTHIEVYILDFKNNIYNRKLTIEFVKKIRNERPFPTVSALIAQIQNDVRTAHSLSI